MFKSQTVFIVGAGASAEIDMPVGAELQSQIANLWPLFDGRGRIRSGAGDVDLFRAASPASDSQSGYIRAADAIRTGLMGTRSIDEFLEWHSANEPIVRLGKAAIRQAH